VVGHGNARRRAVRIAARAAAVAGCAVFALASTVGSHAAADLVVPIPLVPITVPLPDPTTTTTVPDPTTTTTAPDPTTTTTAPTTTSSTPRRSTTTTTSVARAGGGGTPANQVSGPTSPGAVASSRRISRAPRARNADRPLFVVPTPFASGATIEPVTAASVPGSLTPDRLRTDFARATTLAPGNAHGFDGSALVGIVLAAATALVLALAQRDAARQRRSQATLVGAGALHLGRDESEAGVRDQLRLMLASGPFTATGSDCRSLQLLVQAAAHEGLEVRDPRGFIVRATNRLQRAYGIEPDRKRLPLRWAVDVSHPTLVVPAGYGYVMARTGPDDRGRLLAFTPGTEMLLWSGDCL
jgi:hypothetical protein